MKSNKRIFIYLFWFVTLLPAMVFRDFTPNNELRYLSIIDEALQNGNVFTFTNQGEIYADKPPLHFWLMMLGKVIFGGHHMWYYSLLSVLPAFVILHVMYKWTLLAYGTNKCGEKEEQNDISSTIMLMTGGLFLVATLIVRMDMLMNMFIVLSFYSFYKMYVGIDVKRSSILFPVYTFMALFSKGPFGLLFPFVSTVAFLIYEKKIKDFGKYWGWKSFAIIIAGCVIWFAGVYIEGGNDYLYNLTVHQTVGRGIDSFHHSEPFYYYLISMWYSLFPWSFLVIGVLVAGFVKKKADSSLERFLAVIVVSTFVILSAVSSKIAIYSLPIIPFMIYLSMLFLSKLNLQSKWLRVSVAIPAVLFILVLPAMFFLRNMEDMELLDNVFIYAGAAVLMVSGILSIYMIYGKKDIYKSINTIAVGFMLTLFVAGMSLPKVNDYIGWKGMCERASELLVGVDNGEFFTYHIKRSENMDVYLGKDVVDVSRDDLLNGLNRKGVLMLRTKRLVDDSDLNNIFIDNEKSVVGPFTIVVL